MGKYEEVMQMALNLKFGSDLQKNDVVSTIQNLDSEGLVNILEESRGIANDNTGDRRVSMAIEYLINFIYSDLQTRLINSGLSKIGKLFSSV